MSGHVIVWVVGAFMLGGLFGYMTAALMVISADADRRAERAREGWSEVRGAASGKVIEFPDPRKEGDQR